MNPACATLEYASIRFTSVCAVASSDPTTIDTADRTQMNGVQSHASGLNAVSNTRISAANAAIFVAADMNAVTGVGAPWYASGVHMWNGTAETLNANPTASRPIAANASGNGPMWPWKLRAISPRFVVWACPYANAMPYRKNALEKAPSRKYFIEPSLAASRFE